MKKLVLILLFSVWHASLSGAVLRVAHTGEGKFKSIQAAIDAAAPGATIEIAAGTWQENILIRKGVTLKGAGWNETIVELPGNTEPTMEAFWDRVLKELEEMDLAERRKNMRLRLSLSNNQPLRIADAQGVTVSDIGFHWAGPKSINPHVIQQLAEITNASVNLQRVAIVGSAEDGLLVHGGGEVEIRDSLVAGNWGRGIQVNSGRFRLLGSDIRHNYKSHVFISHNVTSARVENCRLYGSAFFGFRAGGTNTVISGNAVFDTARAAFYLGRTSLTVSNNLFLNHAFGAAQAWDGNRDLFVNNTFVNTGRYGFTSIGTAKPILRRNIFWGHDTALQSSVSSVLSPDKQRPGDFELDGNLFSSNRTNWSRLRPDQGGKLETVSVENTFGSVFYDPGFRDPVGRDYSLRSDSRARAAGIGAVDPPSLKSPFPVTAFEKAMIPQSGSWDFKHWRKPPDPDLRAIRSRLMALMSGKPAAPAGSDVTYAQAFEDLYLHLGKRYPNFELKGIDWEAVGRELGPRGAKVKNDEEFGLLCWELVARLEDSHAYLRKGSINPPGPPFPRWDAGFACLLDAHGDVVIYDIAPISSAAEKGLQVGMTIDSINGKPVQEAIAETMQLLKRFVGYSSERYLKYHAVRWFARQHIQKMPLKVVAADHQGNRKLFALEATSDLRYLPRRPVPTPGISDTANVSWTMLPGDIGLIYVRRIKGDLVPKLDAAVTDLSVAKGLIIDVRGNSGGGFDNRAHLNFSPDFSKEPKRPRFLGPMAVLIDSRCISAGEGWASWFVASKRAKFFGTATAGASARKETYALKNQLFQVTFPVKPYRGFLDRIIERRGLEPHQEVRLSAADVQKRRDSVMEAAREELLRSVK